ncbi:MAG: hypothetical protein ACRDHU_06395 [Actinomycetota bacterium]
MLLPAYEERIDEAGTVLAWLRDALDDEEREHLALELLDVTRQGDGNAYQRLLTPWVLTVFAKQHPAFEAQAKEYYNLEASGELFAGVDFGSLSPLTT